MDDSVSPPTSPTKRSGTNALPITRPNRASSTSMPPLEDYLTDYLNLKFKEKLTRKDFDDSIMDTLRQLPLFQAIQVIHRFNDSVGPRVVNRQAFLVSIIRSTQRWWTPSNGEGKVYFDGPNTALIVQLCMNSNLNPDVFTPAVCHALQLLTPEQVIQVAQTFGSTSIALHVAHDSYYAKQQLFLSMAHAALMNFHHAPRGSEAVVDQIFLNENLIPEAPASEAAALGRLRADAAAASQLPGILSEFIARTCAISKTISESDLDATARDALKRVALLQAMQAVQHFSLTMSDQIQKRSAYLMGILRGQEQHWERSRASKHVPGGAKELLNLHPRLLLKIAHLCLDGNCVPSDFSPEVCYELKFLDCDVAIKAVMSFNNNKRIAAGPGGGVINRVGFLHGLLRNIKQADSINSNSASQQNLASAENGNSPIELQTSTKSFAPLSPPELNPQAKPYSPVLTASSSKSGLATITVGTTGSSSATISSNCTGPSVNPNIQVPSEQNSQDLARLLDSSRDAISFLTAALARSRTSEIRLRRELAESQAQVQHLMNTLLTQRESYLKQIDIIKTQSLAQLSRSFDGLSSWVSGSEHTNQDSLLPNQVGSSVIMDENQ